ncbi:hypothetical protein FJZ33_02290 [Candidatus Poribacteria bacterium]|nr:hypothetical protein [Candidatus Poribacteria bacterium]
MSQHQGTQRLISSRETLSNVKPYWSAFGLTRCIDITALDRLGIPVYAGVRPRGTCLQVSSGKGITHENSSCSAVMEALEIYHAENPAPSVLSWACEEEVFICNESLLFNSYLDNQILYRYRDSVHAAKIKQAWIRARELTSGKDILIPAGMAYFLQPSRHSTTTNGLASGNSLEEATLHALYEVIERDSVSALCVDGKVKLATIGKVVDSSSITSMPLVQLIRKIHDAECEVKLIYVPNELPVYVYIAYILDPNPLNGISYLHVGYGCHADQEIAATRSVTEAAQARLIFIHSSREDIYDTLASANKSRGPSKAFKFIRKLKECTPWDNTKKEYELEASSIQGALKHLLNDMSTLAHPVYRHVLHCEIPKVSVVKVIVPTMRFNQALI